MKSGQESHGARRHLSGAFWRAVMASSILLPSAALHFKSMLAHDRTRFLLAWLVPFWALIELIPTKLPHYPLPVLPAAVLLLLWSVDRVVTLSPVQQKLYLPGQYLFLAFGMVQCRGYGRCVDVWRPNCAAGGWSGCGCAVACWVALWQGHRWIQTGDYLHLMALFIAGMLVHLPFLLVLCRNFPVFTWRLA